MKEKEICRWCKGDTMMEKYHNEEWGIACHNDQQLYEYLILEAMSCGLSWKLMLMKREIFRTCFANFDYMKVAQFTHIDVERIMQYPGIIKSKRKIEAMISNAQAFIKIRNEFETFDKYIWSFTKGKTIIYNNRPNGMMQTQSKLSDIIAKDLKKRGFKFLGSVLVYSFIQAIGMVNDHDTTCYMFNEIGGDVIE
ncbi:DNA-3-methyladenine glycosylase I [Hoylesella nanceiensis]|jgi:DNA-3-methyladenine glycosylase I|uniref:DNA-3-methyladenine glycosylase I n=1 Tax=Hoylesella nanceiensis TaxID=425941 RepID=UPI001CAC366C|nr:DNA-3-methyladenine glycosylase I [Hoylesella nanceiensis]MBF1439739.1 DNA-3-methyladenine glycosylase I [Hoylesella nanceiensis]